MNKSEFAWQMGKLETFYPSFNVTDDKDTLKTWYSIFEFEDAELFSEAVGHFITTSKYNPSVAGLREAMIDVASPNLPSVDDEFEKIKKIITIQAGSDERRTLYKSLHNITRKALESIGGIEGVRKAPDYGKAKQNFCIAFNRLVNEPALRALKSKSITEEIKRNVLMIGTKSSELS
ncbi:MULTISPECIES: replicative helicase loader/inhibitor [unclassified Fusibacter]|uniref:replicative helicase loader/inhibitor n=1 Tax=unclassified Fusibacter TaxID=2624464 RepID=UPI0013E929E4|nr:MULTISPECIES: replicative helicase loader/inhibitor [unclassified Fusibacter]MCK8059726.1 replicative helicase loader/inhibitor [Fusibacter sp. A2]NPE21527.1 hypothetical protein [Fusibacter sp. A1]